VANVAITNKKHNLETAISYYL